jgi:hypothetical protein
MCNLYAVTKGQQAIRELTRAMSDRTGNLPPLPGIFPDDAAPIVRNQPEGRQLTMARWGMPSPVSPCRLERELKWLNSHDRGLPVNRECAVGNENLLSALLFELIISVRTLQQGRRRMRADDGDEDPLGWGDACRREASIRDLLDRPERLTISAVEVVAWEQVLSPRHASGIGRELNMSPEAAHGPRGRRNVLSLCGRM